MELYHSNMSVSAQKVRLVIAEKGLKPDYFPLDLRAGATHAPEYLQLNPNGTVPTLVDRGEAIVESSIICEYLDEAYPATRLRPVDPLDRAKMRQWTILPDAWLHKACTALSYAVAFRHLPLEGLTSARNDPKIRARWMELLIQGLDSPWVTDEVVVFDRILTLLANRLGTRSWLVSDHYTLADIAMVPYVLRLENLALSWLWEDEPPREGIKPWLERCRAQKGFRGIADYLSQADLSIMREKGQEARDRIAAILGQGSAA